MSLKNLLFSAIQNVYPNALSLDAVNEICDSGGHKRSNGERRLRELSNGEYPPIKPIKGNRGYIIGYKFVKYPVSPKSSLTLDDQLKNILFVTRLTFENAGKIKEINKALKSKHEYYKKMIITKYK